MKTLAQKANHDFSNGDFKIRDINNNIIYQEDEFGYWAKYEYDIDGTEIHFKNSYDYVMETEDYRKSE